MYTENLAYNELFKTYRTGETISEGRHIPLTPEQFMNLNHFITEKVNENYADYNITVSLEKIMADNDAYFYVYTTSEGEVMNEIFISSDRYQFEVLVLANEDFTILGLDTDTI